MDYSLHFDTLCTTVCARMYINTEYCSEECLPCECCSGLAFIARSSSQASLYLVIF